MATRRAAAAAVVSPPRLRRFSSRCRRADPPRRVNSSTSPPHPHEPETEAFPRRASSRHEPQQQNPQAKSKPKPSPNSHIAPNHNPPPPPPPGSRAPLPSPSTAMDAAPPSPAVLAPSGSSPLPPTLISLPDTPASADTETPFSDAATASDADASAVAAVAVDGAPGDGEDDGINNPTAGAAGKHMTLAPPAAPSSKRSKKKGGNSVWTRPASRKGKKKAKQPGHGAAGANGGRPRPSADEDEFLLTPAPRLAADRNDDAPELPVLLSRVYKSDRIEVSEDRLTAGSTKGFRMIRATRGVATGAWYFEIKVVHLGPSGHTRLGLATNRADLQTPVGCDKFGFAYRDVDGSKVTKAWRSEYAAEGYGEGDVLGFYISLPEGELYEPKQPYLVNYKGMPFHAQGIKDESETPDPVPESEICYFKNGVCQGTAFVNIPGGRYYPAASMYTLPDEPNCEVRFNFGPDFVFFPEDFGGRPVPRPMSEVSYQAYELRNEGPAENGNAEKPVSV